MKLPKLVYWAITGLFGLALLAFACRVNSVIPSSQPIQAVPTILPTVEPKTPHLEVFIHEFEASNDDAWAETDKVQSEANCTPEVVVPGNLLELITFSSHVEVDCELNPS